MGPYRLILAILPFLLASSAAPALAQQQPAENSGPIVNLPRGNAPRAPDNRQGPELDVFRDPATPTVTLPPPVVLPPVVTPTTPPAATPPTTPAPRTQAPAPRREAPVTGAPVDSDRAQPAQRDRQRPAAPTTPAPVQTSDQASETPATPSPQTQTEPPPRTAAPAEATNSATVPAEPAPAEEAAREGPLWLWIGGGAVLLALILAFLLRRRRDREEDAGEEEATPIPAEPTPAAVEAIPSPAPIAPAPAAAPTPPTQPAPAAVAPPAAPIVAADDRALIELMLEVTAARNSLMGLTVGYALTLSNRGEQAAQDVLVRGLIGNAGSDQQAFLQQFASGETGLPLHSTLTIAPGGSQRLTGELRLTADQFAPLPMGGRLLLIPLAAFDVQYRWGEDSADPAGTGRQGGAFIIGQEQEPPAERLAPFRLDLGPRQYRRPGARVAGQFGRS